MSTNIEKVKEMLEIIDTNLDKYLEFSEENIITSILGRCNIEIIPERLNSLIQEFLIEQCKINQSGVGEGKKEVSSVSDNGQSVNYKTVGGISNMSQNVEEFLNKKDNILSTYRKLRW